MPKSKSKATCCVNGCSSTAKRDDVSFHHFPRKNSRRIRIFRKPGEYEDVDARLLWEKVLKRENSSTQFMRVCSAHFVETDFKPVYEGKIVFRKTLRKTAVPSINLPTRKSDSRPNTKSSIAETENDIEYEIEEDLSDEKMFSYSTEDLAAARSLCTLAGVSLQGKRIQVNTQKLNQKYETN